MPFYADHTVVTRLRNGAARTFLASMLVGLAGCSAAAEGPSTSLPGSPDSGPVTSSPSRATPAPTPPFYCMGATDLASTQRIIGIGGAQALAIVTVAEPQPNGSGAEAQAPALEVELLEGVLGRGDVRNVVIGAANADVVLPKGTYVMLLAPTDVEGDYLLGDGMQGSFMVEGDRVRQRCPNYEDASSPTAAKQSVPLDVLRKNAAAAFDSYRDAAPPTS